MGNVLYSTVDADEILAVSKRQGFIQIVMFLKPLLFCHCQIPLAELIASLIVCFQSLGDLNLPILKENAGVPFVSGWVKNPT